MPSIGTTQFLIQIASPHPRAFSFGPGDPGLMGFQVCESLCTFSPIRVSRIVTLNKESPPIEYLLWQSRGPS